MITIFTDGACVPNPGPGGWGAIIQFNDQIREIGGFQADTTNNQMEILAAIKGLEVATLLCGSSIRVCSDSKYLIDNLPHVKAWRSRGWITKGQKTPVKNRELWESLDQTVESIRSPIEWVFVPGHCGIPGNERADVISEAFASGKKSAMYNGPIGGYGFDLSILEPQFERSRPNFKHQRFVVGKQNLNQGHQQMNLLVTDSVSTSLPKPSVTENERESWHASLTRLEKEILHLRRRMEMWKDRAERAEVELGRMQRFGLETQPKADAIIRNSTSVIVRKKSE